MTKFVLQNSISTDQENVFLVGAGGHAGSVADIIIQSGEYNIVCMLDNEIKARADLYGIPIINECHLKELYDWGIFKGIVAIGDNRIRARISEQLLKRGFELINAVSKHSYVSAYSKLATGIAIMPNATVAAGAFIGAGTIVNTNASVDHDCRIGDFCHIAPGSTLCGNVMVGNGTFICAGAKIIDKITIGSNCVIGAGAVIIHNAADNETMVGVPGKNICKKRQSIL
jgi:UDP-perosamine 4-acetyltransferase